MTEVGQQTLVHALQSYGKRLRGFIRSRVGSEEDAEDIAQEVWFQLSRVIDTEPIEQISAWLFRVARNRIIDSYRKQKPGLLQEWSEPTEEEDEHIPGETIPFDFMPEYDMARETFWQEFFSILEELPEKQKQVFIMNELENLTYEEIALKTGDNIKTLISRKGYAVRFLRERLADWYDEIINN
jgi:RNA polymerase sigma factor (sigma-70 family)